MRGFFYNRTITKRARISECGKYRYTLYRSWDTKKSLMAFIGLNPSKADSTIDDATCRRWMNFARSWGYGGFIAVNAFAWRETNSRVLATRYKAGEDIVGPDNDEVIMQVVETAIITVVCWGAALRQFPERQKQLHDLLLPAQLHCFRLLNDGSPEHPLYIPKHTKPIPWTVPTV